MIKIYDVIDYVSIDDQDWRKISGYGYRVADKELKNTLILDNLSFDEVREYLSQNHLDGVWNDSTFFRNKPMIRIAYSDAWDSIWYRHFNTMSYKREFMERKYVTLEWIMKHLSADQCIQYLKERGMTACPILK